MKKYYFMAMALALALASCSNVEEVAEGSDAGNGKYSVEATVVERNIWETEGSRYYGTRGSSDAQLVYMVYLFDSQDVVIANRGNYITESTWQSSFNSQISAPGTYTLYGVTNVMSDAYPTTKSSPQFTTEQTFTIAKTQTPADICLGKKVVTVKADTLSYSVNISADHIMSKLALTVHNVPADVTSMSITLPKQANTFNFGGVFAGDTLSQTITLSKAETANTDKTYEWTAPATVVFPCATGSTSMPITITWASTTVTTPREVETTSSTCCLSGKNLALATTWSEKFRATANILTNEWGAQESGTFDW